MSGPLRVQSDTSGPWLDVFGYRVGLSPSEARAVQAQINGPDISDLRDAVMWWDEGGVNWRAIVQAARHVVTPPERGWEIHEPRRFVVLAASDADALNEEHCLDDDPFWRPVPMDRVVGALSDALEACAANIQETGAWGIDALQKTRTAMDLLSKLVGT